VLIDEDEEDGVRFRAGRGWGHKRWWYKVAHVCQRWRHLILGSASYLGLCLVCTIGTPVTDMLAHSPPLPVIIDHVYEHRHHHMTAEDEKGITLALTRSRPPRPPSDVRSRFTEAYDDHRRGISYPGIPNYGAVDRGKVNLETSQHVPGTTTTSPPANRLPSYPLQWDLVYSRPPWASSYSVLPCSTLMAQSSR
jgi:hypothetical protein